jgi:preprotein translocase subunit SecG
MLDIVALVLCVLSSLFLIVFILLHSGKGSGL